MPVAFLRPDADIVKTLSRSPIKTRNYTAVNESSPNDATTYVYLYTVGGTLVESYDEYELTNLPSSAASIVSVKLRYRGRATVDGLVRTFTVGIKSGTSVFYDTPQSDDNWATHVRDWGAVSPFSRVTWTVPEVNALKAMVQIRVQSDGGPTLAEADLTFYELEVAYLSTVRVTANTFYVGVSLPPPTLAITHAAIGKPEVAMVPVNFVTQEVVPTFILNDATMYSVSPIDPDYQSAESDPGYVAEIADPDFSFPEVI